MPAPARPDRPTTFPYLRVEGTAYERGLGYGRQAADRIALNVQHYQNAFRDKYAISWDDALRRAGTLLSPIADYDVEAIGELEGIAAGSDQPLEAIVALNARTEIVHAGYIAECTTAAVLPQRSRTGHTLLCQNWDWMRGAATTSVLVHEVTGDVEYLSLHEAGALVRSGFNSAGVGCVGNFVAGVERPDKVGIPLTVIGRKILMARTMREAAGYASAGPRSIGINYLMAAATGEAVDIETTVDDAFVVEPTDGLLLHTNHYLTAGVLDLGLPKVPDSAIRLRRAHELLDPRRSLAVEDFFDVFTDHHNHPRSICKHPAKDGPFADVTLASAVIDLDDGVLWLTQGNPCEYDYERWDVFGTPPATVTPGDVPAHAVSG